MKAKLFFSVIIGVLRTTLMNVHGEDYPDPQPGEIWGGSIESVNAIRTQLAQILSETPAGTEGRGSPWFGKLGSIKAQLDQVAASRTQTDLFGTVPNLAEVFQEKEPLPFVSKAFGSLANLSVDLITSAGAHVEQQNGAVALGVIVNFVKIFAVGDGFVSEANWEEKAMPVDAAGVMILDAPVVVTQLKAGPWQQASQFLGGATTPSGFFARYTGTGDGLAVLKTKYAANQSSINAKFDELKTWADQQELQAAGGN